MVEIPPKNFGDAFYDARIITNGKRGSKRRLLIFGRGGSPPALRIEYPEKG
jgi:hypothetical protein